MNNIHLFAASPVQWIIYNETAFSYFSGKQNISRGYKITTHTEFKVDLISNSWIKNFEKNYRKIKIIISCYTQPEPLTVSKYSKKPR